jgi:hypothetical protein
MHYVSKKISIRGYLNLIPHYFKDIFYILILRTIIITEVIIKLSEVGQ